IAAGAGAKGPAPRVGEPRHRDCGEGGAMTPPLEPMNLARLKTILEAYGALPDCWPAEERAAAEMLVARSTEARAALAQARALDESLAVWQPDVPDAAMARLTAATAFPPPRTAARPVVAGLTRSRGGIGGWLQAAFWPR